MTSMMCKYCIGYKTTTMLQYSHVGHENKWKFRNRKPFQTWWLKIDVGIAFLNSIVIQSPLINQVNFKFPCVCVLHDTKPLIVLMVDVVNLNNYTNIFKCKTHIFLIITNYELHLNLNGNDKWKN